MKRYTTLIIYLLFPLAMLAQFNFHDHFEDRTLRFDFMLAGNHTAIRVYPQQMLEEAGWAGPVISPEEDPGYGTYRFQVFDAATGQLIFRKGFATLFQEWQTTAEAKKMERAFYQAVFMPFPKKLVKLSIEARNWEGTFDEVYSTVIDPADYFIRKEKPVTPDVTSIVRSGDPKDKVDLVFLSEGYTSSEREKFLKDAEEMSRYLFSVAPFSEHRDQFNVSALWVASDDSGTDIPGRNIYRNTRYNSTFYTFDIDRYLTTSDMKQIYDDLRGVTWDHFLVLVNSGDYGGGGFYNLLGIGTTGHPLSQKVMVHEFGHSFAGLGDEYYTSEVAYENYYNLEVEPWEPNLTTMADFESKWKGLIIAGVPVPTPRTEQYTNTVGVFEGGGYMSKGIFSPMMDCRMKSNGADEFCPVCREAIRRTIRLYSK